MLAIGSPFGVGQTVTSGIISALARNQWASPTTRYFIQTDAAINPGNSGGALVDARAAWSASTPPSISAAARGIGFAIPMSTARQVMEGLVKDGQVTRGWIGVEPNDLSPELAETFGVRARQGVIITGVLQNGPAAQAGIRPGDVITSVAGIEIHNVATLLTRVAGLKPGVASRFSLQRQDTQMDIEVVPGVRPTPRRPSR